MNVEDGSVSSIDEKDLESFLEDGGTLAMLKDISKDNLEQLYSLAFNHYRSGKWNDAHTVFKGLCVLDHYDARFFLGLGACRQSMGMLDEALQSYTYGALIDINDPRFPFHAGECHLQLGDFDAAESGFYSAGALASTQPEHSALAERASVMLEAVLIKRGKENAAHNR